MAYLLHTKTTLPPVNARHTPRSRLVERIDANPDARLVLVSAPAGAGKTSCLVEWAHTARQRDEHIVWLALDAGDNDPMRFVAYLLRAFESAAPAFKNLVQSDEQIDLQGAAALILNTATEQDADFALVLDDFHLISEPQIHHVIGTLCQHLPPNLRIVMGTRADPPLQLARLRARGEITEIRMMDLRFTHDEIVDLLQTSARWTLPDHLLDRLESATEGWAAALALVLMSIDPARDQLSEEALEKHLAAYSRTQQHIFDYFAAEVLSQQSETVQDFLLDTCVLDQLRPEVCRALTGSDDAPLLLTQLARKSLFVIPLSNFEPVYRYHHLFEDFLRQQLILQDPQHYQRQHQMAAKWYAIHGDITDAVRHALDAEDYDFAAALIEETAWQTLTARGEIMTVLHWLSRFSEEVLRRYPRLCLYFSRAFYLTGDIDRSATYVQMASDEIAQHSENDDERALRAIAANYQATLAGYRGDIEAGIRLNEQAEGHMDAVEPLDRVRITNTSAHLRLLWGNVPDARDVYETALWQAREIGHHYLTLDAQYYLARLDLMAGELKEAKARCEQALAGSPDHIVPRCLVMLPLACVHYEQNNPVEAERLLRDAVDLARRGNIPDVLWLAYAQLARVLAARGELGEAADCTQQARYIASRFNSAPMLPYIDAAEARIALQSHNLEAASDWAASYDPTAQVEYQHDVENLTLARVWLAESETNAALNLLTAIIEEAGSTGRNGHAIEAEMLCALAYQTQNRLSDALDTLEIVLLHAEREGYIRLLLDEDRPMLTLLQQAVERDIVPDYAQRLLSIDRQADDRHPADALTDRELEVLAVVATGASNQEIADELVVSVNTVKSHIHNIMNKLDAANRTEAVAKARSLNLLDV